MPTAPTATPSPGPTEPAPPAGGWQQYVVSGTVGLGLRLRRTPGGEPNGVYTEGIRLQQIGPDWEAEGLLWRNVRMPDGVEGWVAAKYAILERFVVTGTQGEGLRLRRTPGGDVLGSYRDGTHLDQIGPDQKAQGVLWRHVRAPGDVDGWVAAEHTILATLAPPPPVAPPARLFIPSIGVNARSNRSA